MLEPELLLDAYRHGIFPMAVSRCGDIGWFSPDPRAIIPLDDRFRIPHGLRRVLKKCLVEGEAPAEPKCARTSKSSSPGLRRADPGCAVGSAEARAASSAQAGGSPSKTRFIVSFDTDFESVIRACAKRKEGTWISKEIIESYCELHRLGHAHSVEVRLRPKAEIPRQARNDKTRKPVGGLYGVHIGGAFFGESMFYRVTDASKVALVALVERLRARGFVLLDTQWLTPHLAQFGTYEIRKNEYMQRLRGAVKLDCRF